LAIIHKETRQLIAETRSHRNPVSWISMHPKQHTAITSAKSEAILWNMADWSKQKVLNHIKEGVELRRVCTTKLTLKTYFKKKFFFNITL